jgi:Ca2+-transporting ATPase
VYAGIGIVLALQALFVFAPFMQRVFGSAALGARELLWAAVASTAVLPVTWLEERWRVRRARTSVVRHDDLPQAADGGSGVRP